MKPTINITHWDADGIVSSVLLTKIKGKNYSYVIPEIGNFFLSAKIKNSIKLKKPEKVVITDINLPIRDILFLKEFAEVEIYDHHHSKLIEGVYTVNPIAEGRLQSDYPSCSYVIAEHFGVEKDLLVWAGVWGDVGFKLKEDSLILKKLNDFLNRNNIPFKEFKMFVDIIDSQHKADNGVVRVNETIDFLLSHEPFDILCEEKFSLIPKIVNEKIEELYSKRKSFGELNLIVYSDEFYLASQLCRKLYKEYPEKLNVVIGIRGEYVNYYIRSKKINFKKTIEKFKEKGYFAGGKDDVMGIVIHKDRLISLIEDTYSHIFKNIFPHYINVTSQNIAEHITGFGL